MISHTEPIPFNGLIVYITDSKKDEEALRKSEKIYRRLAENSRAMIYRQSLPDGRYEFQIIHKSGDTTWLRQQNVLVYDETGSLIVTQGIKADQTKLKQVSY